jgi:hypothetical protein
MAAEPALVSSLELMELFKGRAAVCYFSGDGDFAPFAPWRLTTGLVNARRTFILPSFFHCANALTSVPVFFCARRGNQSDCIRSGINVSPRYARSAQSGNHKQEGTDQWDTRLISTVCFNFLAP